MTTCNQKIDKLDLEIHIHHVRLRLLGLEGDCPGVGFLVLFAVFDVVAVNVNNTSPKIAVNASFSLLGTCFFFVLFAAAFAIIIYPQSKLVLTASPLTIVPC